MAAHPIFTNSEATTAMKFDKLLIASTAHGIVLLTTAITFAQKVDAPNPKTPSTPSSAASEQQPVPQSPAVDQGQGATSPAEPAPQTNVAGANTAPATLPAAAPVAAAPQQCPAVVTSPVEPKPPMAESREAPAPSLPTKLALGKDGWLQVGALLQGWFDTQWNSNLPAGTTFRNTKSTFRMRRAELKLSGDIVKDVASFLVTFDPASTYKSNTTNYTVPNGAGSGTQTITTSSPPGNTAALKLFWVTLKSRFVEASIGQFKYPISYEGQTSSAELIFPERGYSSRYFGDTYDMGIRLEKKLDWFKYQVFLLNGSGQNQLDTNLQKDLAARLEFTPIEGITVGTAGLTSLGQRVKQATTKDTVELFGRLTKAGFLVQGELLWGATGCTASGKTNCTASGLERTKAAGRYVIIGYTIADKIQPVIRYGYLNTDKTTTVNDKTSYALYTPFNVVTDEVRSYEIGLNYFVQGHNFKLQAAYGYYDFDNIPALQEFTVAGQAAF
jgi:hypothetical protein